MDARDHRNELDTSVQLRLIALAALLGCTPAELPALTVHALPDLARRKKGVICLLGSSATLAVLAV